jgi:coenzyme PQQ biosynthesis protein PqqD
MAASVTQPRKMADIKWKKIGKAGILLNLRTGDYFELDETALAIWNMLDGKTPLAQVASKLAKTYAAPRQTVEKDVIRFVSELRKRKLIDTGKS